MKQLAECWIVLNRFRNVLPVNVENISISDAPSCISTLSQNELGDCRQWHGLCINDTREDYMTTSLRYIRQSPEEKSTLLDNILGALRERRRVIYIAVAAVFLLATVYYFLQPNHYVATARVLPNSSQGGVNPSAIVNAALEGSALSGLLPSGSGSESDIYVEMLRRRPVLDDVLTHLYDTDNYENQSLYDIWRLDQEDVARRRLLASLNTGVDSKTGVVKVSISGTDPSLSAEIANQFVRAVDWFKQRIDRERAADVSAYLARKLEKQKNELRIAEERKASFLDSNMNYLSADDPDLLLDLERHEREVVFQKQLLMSLMQFKATTDMESEKEIPRLSVLEWAEAPSVKAGPQRIKSIFMTTILGLVFVVGLISLKETYKWHFPQQTRAEIEDSYLTIKSDFRGIVNRIKSRVDSPEEILK